MNYFFLFFFILGFLGKSFSLETENDSAADLLRDLTLVENINRKIEDSPPFFYNSSMMGGYFTMPSARMNKAGTVAFGGGSIPPYSIYGLNIQPLDRIELSANYLVYNGLTEPGFGNEGYGDDAERMGNIKIGILTASEDLPFLPIISIGAQDFIGTCRFNAQYIVGTQTFAESTLECTLGWGHGRIKGFFGGIAWFPFHNYKTFFKDFAFKAEYDANNYKKSAGEHPSGRTVKSRINGGISLSAFEYFQLSVSSLRGEQVAVSASVNYPLGSTQGFFPKTNDPKKYTSPVNTESLGMIRPEEDFAHELAYAFSDRGLDLFRAYLQMKDGKKELWISVVNNRYRDHLDVKERIEAVLGAITPSDIEAVTVTVEATGLLCQSYRFRTEDLYKRRQGIIGSFEMQTLAPMKEVSSIPNEYEAITLFKRTRPIWTFTARPRIITFFGNTNGKFKCNLSATGSPEGYIFDDYYYKTLLSYSIYSSTKGMTGVDRLNPSHMFAVRSDSMKYHQNNTLHLEQAFLQRSINLSKGFFYRLAAGYFEIAYGGIATEFLYYPVHSPFAIGIECATVWKRQYNGIRFFKHVGKFDGTKIHYLPFIGVQAFLTFYYDYKPLAMDCKITIGRFLAKDLGAKFELGRYFKSGMRFSLWYSLTNANEELNGHKYHDKGFSFLIPLDMFMKQSSRNYVGYAMAAWLRDQAAQADTGKKLYSILSEERYFP